MTDNQLLVITNQAGLAEEKSKQLLSSFGNYFSEARQKVKQAKEIVVSDISQVEEMRKARETRLELKNIRVEVEKTRKQLKEQSIRENKAIDGISNVIKALIVPAEEYLENQEKFAERLETERKAKVEAERINQLSKFVEGAENYSLHPDLMSEETFSKLLENSRLAFEARKKAEEDVEKARLAQIEADRIEQERIRQENAKLKIEAEKREKELAKEREKIAKENAIREAKLAKERAEQQKKLEAEQKKQRDLEEKLRQQKEAQLKKEAEELAKVEAEKKRIEEEARKKLLAPDKEKLLELALSLDNFNLPAVSSKEAMAVIRATEAMIGKMTGYIREKAKTL